MDTDRLLEKRQQQGPASVTTTSVIGPPFPARGSGSTARGGQCRRRKFGYCSESQWLDCKLDLLRAPCKVYPAALPGLALIRRTAGSFGVYRCHRCNRTGSWRKSTTHHYLYQPGGLLPAEISGSQFRPHGSRYRYSEKKKVLAVSLVIVVAGLPSLSFQYALQLNQLLRFELKAEPPRSSTLFPVELPVVLNNWQRAIRLQNLGLHWRFVVIRRSMSLTLHCGCPVVPAGLVLRRS